MQAQKWRLLPYPSPFAGLSAAGPPEMDLPECVDDITQWAFHKGISPGSLSGSLRHSHRYHQFVAVRGFAGQIVPEPTYRMESPSGCPALNYSVGR
jgi:hypothetical protein